VFVYAAFAENRSQDLGTVRGVGRFEFIKAPKAVFLNSPSLYSSFYVMTECSELKSHVSLRKQLEDPGQGIFGMKRIFGYL
jgi:hypothetical protein